MLGRIRGFLERSASFRPETQATNGTNRFEDVYTLHSSLGKGSYAVVYLTTRNTDQVKYATKVMDKRKMKMSDLKSELTILQEVNHPNVAGLVDFYESERNVYLVMELAEGGTLFEDIQERGSFTEADATIIVTQLLNAIEYLHMKDIVHRDLKPENILMKDKSELSPICITDFGLSKFTLDDFHLQTVCGSPFYVAPEVLRAKYGTHYGRPADMWSLGVIVYILLSGYPPFWAETDGQVFQRILKRDFDFDPEYWGDISDSAKDFISKLLELDPVVRLTAGEALQHEWLQSASSTNLMPNILRGKARFKKIANAIRLVGRMRRLSLANGGSFPSADPPKSVVG